MGKIEFAGCQDVRNQTQIVELECPNCHEPDGVEAFVKEQTTVGDSVCAACGYVLPEGTVLYGRDQ